MIYQPVRLRVLKDNIFILQQLIIITRENWDHRKILIFAPIFKDPVCTAMSPRDVIFPRNGNIFLMFSWCFARSWVVSSSLRGGNTCTNSAIASETRLRMFGRCARNPGKSHSAHEQGRHILIKTQREYINPTSFIHSTHVNT